MFFNRLKTPGLGQNSYVLGCGNSGSRTLAQMTGVRVSVFVILFVPLRVLSLFALDRLTP